MLEVRRARPDEIDTCLAIRHEVFVLGQGVPAPLEVDGKDPHCTHFIALERGEALGTARLRVTDKGSAKIERVAVRPGHQGKGLGTAIMHAVEEEAAARGFREVVLTAQVGVIPFYETLGYVAEGNVFIEAAIKHRWMKKRLGAQA